MSGTIWGADPMTMRTNALALRYSRREYASPCAEQVIALQSDQCSTE